MQNSRKNLQYSLSNSCLNSNYHSIKSSPSIPLLIISNRLIFPSIFPNLTRLPLSSTELFLLTLAVFPYENNPVLAAVKMSHSMLATPPLLPPRPSYFITDIAAYLRESDL
jgi:hypothetical protein